MSLQRMWIMPVILLLAAGCGKEPAPVALQGIARCEPDAESEACTVKRGEFLHQIVARGNLESASNVEIRCEVRASGSSGTRILYVIPEGTKVQSGDVLVKLDSSALESDLTKQQIACNNGEAELVEAQCNLDAARIKKQAYIEGTYMLELLSIHNRVSVAHREVRQAKEDLIAIKQRVAEKNASARELEDGHFAVQKASDELNLAQTSHRVLEKFTKECMLCQLDNDIKVAEAKLKSQQGSYGVDMARLKQIESQIEKCIIKAPQAGQVVYANETSWRGTKETVIAPGELVREGQVVIRMHDSAQLQVVAKINEAEMALVSPGMPATIRLDAFPDRELQGTVEVVDELPEPAPFSSNPDRKGYAVTIRLNNLPSELRVGLTAEVKILVDRQTDVLLLPVQAVAEHGGRYYCLLRTGADWSPRELTLGSNNDRLTIVCKGLQEGQQVARNAAAYRDRFERPRS